MLAAHGGTIDLIDGVEGTAIEIDVYISPRPRLMNSIVIGRITYQFISVAVEP
jgi:hypothetical protein